MSLPKRWPENERMLRVLMNNLSSDVLAYCEAIPCSHCHLHKVYLEGRPLCVKISISDLSIWLRKQEWNKEEICHYPKE